MNEEWFPKICMMVEIVDPNECGGHFELGYTGKITCVDSEDSFQVDYQWWYCRDCTRPVK